MDNEEQKEDNFNAEERYEELIEEALTNGMSPRDVTIGKMRAAGASLEKIGQEVGLGKTRVGVLCQRQDIKAIIENEQRRLVSLVPAAVDNYKHWISKGIITTNKDEREVAFKASTKVLESSGILNGSQSILIQNVYNDNKTIISPVIMTLLEEFKSKLLGVDDIIEGEVAEDNS